MSGLTVANGRVPDGASSLSGFRGGGILNFGTLTLKNVTITGNRTGNGGDGGAGGAGGSGGGILNSFGTLIVINSTVSDNQTGNGGNGSGSGGSAGGGAGIFNEGGSLTLLNSTVSGNQTGNGGSVVTGPGGFGGGGGGLLNSGTITLINTTISSNHTGNGGSSTSGSIGPGGFGGGISNSGTLTVINSTVALNSTGNGVGANGSSGGGIVTNTLGLTNLRNTIVANNTIGAGSGPDLSGPFNSDDYNLIGNTAGATITGSTSHNIVNQNTNLGSLVNNGGQTQTMLPLPGSPAISAGYPLNLPADTFDLDGDSDTAEPLPLDQRGFARVVGTNFDIGAVEVNYTIMADAATPQSAIINTAFATQFQARIQESGVNQSGIPITFTAPVTGPSGSFSGSATVNTNASGIATAPVFTANGIAGGYNVVASLSGGSPATNFSLINMPLVAVNDVSITEGNSGTASLTFTVTLSTASNLMVSVNCATADGSATTADNDYQSASGLLTFNPGDLTKTVTVLVNGDQKTEADETLFVVLSSPVNAAFGDSQGTGTILNDDTLQLMLDTSGPDPNQAAALDSLLLVRDPLHALSFAEWWNLGDDKNTRVIVFASDLTLSLGESVTVELIDRNGQIQNITAEDVRPLPNLSFTQVKFRLPNGIPAGNCLITLKAQGRTSNTGTFRISP